MGVLLGEAYARCGRRRQRPRGRPDRRGCACSAPGADLTPDAGQLRRAARTARVHRGAGSTRPAWQVRKPVIAARERPCGIGIGFTLAMECDIRIVCGGRQARHSAGPPRHGARRPARTGSSRPCRVARRRGGHPADRPHRSAAPKPFALGLVRRVRCRRPTCCPPRWRPRATVAANVVETHSAVRGAEQAPAVAGPGRCER
ncbi:hypothetical protein ACU686_18705 [Yinghuangia aomiensis]